MLEALDECQALFDIDDDVRSITGSLPWEKRRYIWKEQTQSKETSAKTQNKNTNLIRSKFVHDSKHKVIKRTYTKSQNHVNSAKHVSNKYLAWVICKTWQVSKCVHQVCMRCAYVMHVQGMVKHNWVKVCKTHTQWSKHNKHI